MNVLDGCNFPSLKTFSSIVDLSPWAPMANFLHRHPTITHLCIGGEVPGQECTLPPGTLPALQTFMGSRRLVSAFVPRRPVSRATLAWHSPNVEVEVDCVIPFLSKSSVPLTSFSCATPGWSSALVRSIAAYLPELKSIRLLNVSADYHNEAVSDVLPLRFIDPFFSLRFYYFVYRPSEMMLIAPLSTSTPGDMQHSHRRPAVVCAPLQTRDPMLAHDSNDPHD